METRKNKLSSYSVALNALIPTFQFLNEIDDFKAVSLVCKLWLKTTQDPEILENFQLSFRNIFVGRGTRAPLSLFAGSDRKFSNIYFENVKFSAIDEDFWKPKGETITKLSFNYSFATIDIPGMNFLKLLLYTPNLQTLNLTCCLHLCNKFMEELTGQEENVIFENLKNVKQLQLYFGDDCIETLEFQEWLEEMSNLNSIDFSLTCKKTNIVLSTYDPIFDFINYNGTKIKKLNISGKNSMDKSVLQRLLAVKGLKLKAFEAIVSHSASADLTKFLRTQTELQFLTIDGTFDLEESFKAMPKLEKVSLGNNSTIDGFEVFNNLSKLCSLGIAAFNFIEKDGLKENTNLKELGLIDAIVDFELPFIRRLCDSFPNIQALNLNRAMIDDEGLQYIFQLKRLKDLTLSNTEITDFGFVGNQDGKKRKSHDMKFSINSLKDLFLLNIDFCHKIKEKSFLALKLQKLTHLSAQGYRLSPEVFISLGKNCPSIELLNVSHSPNLSEKEVEPLATFMTKVETLEVASCPCFNKSCLLLLMNHCKKLQTLDVSKTKIEVKSVAYEAFLAIKSLQQLIGDEGKLFQCHYITHD